MTGWATRTELATMLALLHDKLKEIADGNDDEVAILLEEADKMVKSFSMDNGRRPKRGQ